MKSIRKYFMLGSQIKSLVNDKLQQEANEIQRLKEQKDSKTLREIKNVEDLFTYLKAFTKQIADGERKLETDKNGKVFITNTKEIFGRNYYGALFTQNINKNLITVLEETKLPVTDIINDIKTWIQDNDIESIEVRNEYVDVGIESWNSYWIKLK